MVFVALWPVAGGCASAPPADPAPVVRAFADCLYTYYAARAQGSRAEGRVLAMRADAGGRLVDELAKRGVRVSDEEAGRGLIAVVPHVERFLHTRTEDWTLAVVSPPATAEEARKAGADAWPGSVLVASGVERRSGLAVSLAGRSARYALLTYDRDPCLPFEAYVARSRTPGEEPRLFVVGDAIYARRGSFREDGKPPAGPGDVSLEEAVDLAAASLLFRDERDPARREAMTAIALLDGPRAPLALAILGATQGAPSTALALESLRRAGVEPGAGDAASGAGWTARLARTTLEECHAIVKSSRERGGLLDSSRGP